MKKYRFVLLLLSAAIIITGVCGCAMNNKDLPENENTPVSPALKDEGETYVLNQRQKEILASQGFDLPYEELPFTVQDAIKSIEAMLSYAEEKYGMEFCYSGYCPPGPAASEYMTAWPAGGDMKLDSFKIKVTPEGYEDEYMLMALTGSFEKYARECIGAELQGREPAVFAIITKALFDKMPETYSELDGNIDAAMWIFFDSAAVPDAEEAKAAVQAFMEKHEIYGQADIILIKAGELPLVNVYNYTDFFSEEHCLSRDSIGINRG